jgi:hypothetical protein
MKFSARRQGLAGGFVVAGSAAGFAVKEAVLTKANFEDRLAKATVLFALALGFRHVALGAAVFGGTGSGGHGNNVALGSGTGNVPLVTGLTTSSGERPCRPYETKFRVSPCTRHFRAGLSHSAPFGAWVKWLGFASLFWNPVCTQTPEAQTRGPSAI